MPDDLSGGWTRLGPVTVPDASPAQELSGGWKRLGPVSAPEESGASKLWDAITGKPGQGIGERAVNAASQLWQNLTSTGNILGRKNVLTESAEVQAEHPYRPGMKMEQMGATELRDPMIYSFPTGNIGGGPIGGGRVEPLPPEAVPPAAPPIIPPGQQPPPLGGQALPPAQPAAPAPPGGAAGPVAPVPVVPPGMQPPIRGGQAMPPQQPGVPAAPGAAAGPIPPRPEFTPAPPLRAEGPAQDLRGTQGTASVAGGRAEPGELASGIAANDAGAVDRALVRSYRRGVRPGKPAGFEQNPLGALSQQNRQITSAVDNILRNRPNLRLTNEAGQIVNQPVPTSLRQFAEALDQTKRGFFARYDEMAQNAGAKGIEVELSPVAAELRKIAESPSVRDVHPNVRAEALAWADRLDMQKAYSPAQAQDVIESLNKSLAAYWKNPVPGEPTSAMGLHRAVVGKLLDQLDHAIETASGPGYRELRSQYGAMRSVEKDVGNAVRKQAAKEGGGIVAQMMEGASDYEVLHGILTANIASLGRGLAFRGARMYFRYMNNPNRAIAQMFRRRAETLAGGLITSAPVVPGRSALLPVTGLGAITGQTGMAAQSPAPDLRASLSPPPSGSPGNLSFPPRRPDQDYIEPPGRPQRQRAPDQPPRHSVGSL